MYTYHSTLKYLVNKPVLGGKICRWRLIFQEFDCEAIVKAGRLNSGRDHLSRIESGNEPSNLDDSLSDSQLFTTTFRSKIRRLLSTARGFLFLNSPKITRLIFFLRSTKSFRCISRTKKMYNIFVLVIKNHDCK